MKEWKPVFQNFLWVNDPQSSHQGRWNATFVLKGGSEKSQNGFFTYNLEVESFKDLSLDLKLVEWKPSYDNLKILVDSEITNEVSQLTQTQNLKMDFFPWVILGSMTLEHRLD